MPGRSQSVAETTLLRRAHRRRPARGHASLEMCKGPHHGLGAFIHLDYILLIGLYCSNFLPCGTGNIRPEGYLAVAERHVAIMICLLVTAMNMAVCFSVWSQQYTVKCPAPSAGLERSH